jgi:tetratricopeptide (TPR) repeat protein
VTGLGALVQAAVLQAALQAGLAHPGAEDRLAAGATDGCDAAAWLAVSRGYVEEGRRAEALAAVGEAERCGIDASVAQRARAQLAVHALSAGAPGAAVEQALSAVDGALAVNPGDRALLRDRRRLLARLGRVGEASEVAAGLTGGVRPSPDDVLAAVELLVAAGDPEGALRVADAAILRIGPAPAIVEAALGVELALGRTAAALGRVDGLPATAAWLDWRGRIAMRAGDPAAAADAWSRALALVARRSNAANRATAAELEALLQALGRPGGVQPR